MSNDQAQKNIIVLGMHRSGTSMIAGVLQKLGVNMGRDCIGASVNNPFGHFEDIDLIALNQKILSAVDADWKHPPLREAIYSLKDKFNQPIKQVFNQNRDRLRGWKDPRTSITIELLLPYLNNPYFVVCRRSKQAVKGSLQERSLIEFDGGQLWQEYNQRIDNFFDHHPNLKKIEVQYEKFIRRPKRNINRIISFLAIKPRNNQIERARNHVRSPEEKKSWLYRIQAVPRLPQLVGSWLQLVLKS